MPVNTIINKRTVVVIALCASIIVLAALAIYASSKALSFKESTNQLNTSSKIIAESQDLLNAVNQQYVAYRKYAFSPEAGELEKLISEKLLFEKKLSLLSKFSMSPSQLTLLDTIQKIHSNNSNITAFESKPDSASAARLVLFENYNYSRLKYLITELINQEKARQLEKTSLDNQSFSRVISIVILSSLIAIFIIICAFFYILNIYNKLTAIQNLLHKSQERLESIFEELPIGIIIANLNANRYHANKKALELAEKSIESDGFVLDDTNSPDGMNDLISDTLISDALNGKKNIGVETALTIGSKKLPIRVSSIPLYNEANEIEHAIAVFDDITDIKRAETELKQANLLIEESLKLKEIFLTNMSHEIRTPMNAILGFAELLSQQQISEKGKEYVSTILSAGNNLLRILDDILDFSKLDAKMMIFEESPVEINTLLVEVIKLHSQKAADKGIKLVYRPNLEIVSKVLIDPVRLSQVINNIIGNAIKFTDSGYINVQSRIINEDSEAINIEFKIADTGIGISENKLNSVFRRFEQASNYSKYGGTGLGLSIAKHIVELQGGHISAESNIGKGSVFTFNLPLKKYNGSTSLKADDVVTSNKNFKEGILRILLIEDNQFNISLAKGIFSSYPVDLDVAETGKSGLQKLQSNKYDLALIDIELPDTKGYDLCIAARKDLNLSIPIVALTAHAMAAERDRCLAAGMNEYITKPIKIESLISRISVLTGFMLKKIVLTETQNENGAETPSSLICLDYLHEISDDNPEFEKEILTLFAEQATKQSEILTEALEERDIKAASAAIHTIKSLAAMFLDKKIPERIEVIYKKTASENFSRQFIDECAWLSQVLHTAIIESKTICEDLPESELADNTDS